MSDASKLPLRMEMGLSDPFQKRLVRHAALAWAESRACKLEYEWSTRTYISSIVALPSRVLEK